MATLGKGDASLGAATLGKHLERNEKEGEEEGTSRWREGEGEEAREVKKRRGRRKEEKGEGGKQVKRRAGQYAQAGHKESTGEGRGDAQ